MGITAQMLPRINSQCQEEFGVWPRSRVWNLGRNAEGRAAHLSRPQKVGGMQRRVPGLDFETWDCANYPEPRISPEKRRGRLRYSTNTYRCLYPEFDVCPGLARSSRKEDSGIRWPRRRNSLH